MSSHPLSEQQITLDLLIRLNGDYPATTILLALLLRNADRAPVRVSSRTLAASTHLGHQVVQRALQRLARCGLITSHKVGRAAGMHTVEMTALRRLLSGPLPERAFLPGFTPIPALAQLKLVDSPSDVLIHSI